MRRPNWLRKKKDREIGIVFTTSHKVTDDQINQIFMKLVADSTKGIASFQVIMK